MQTITYEVNNGLYINMTNRCPCSCVFCIRNNAPGVYGSDPLWLDHEPTVEEVCADLDRRDQDAQNPKMHKLDSYDEIVFCGYGEPMERLDDLLKVAAYIKSKTSIPIRINTNGLADLIYGEKTAYKLKGLIDIVSISLNATNKEDYLKAVRPKFGIESYDAMLAYAKDARNYVPDVVMTVVDVVTTKEEQEEARRICESVGARFRVREYSS